MADTPKRLASAQLGSSDAAVYTGTAAHVYTVSDIVICNTDIVVRTFRLHIVPAAGSSSAANAVFYDQIIEANSTIRGFARGWVLTGAEMIRGMADAASKVSVHVFGIDTA